MREHVIDGGIGFFHEASAGLRFGMTFHFDTNPEFIVERMQLVGKVQEDACKIIETHVENQRDSLTSKGLTRIAYDPTSHPRTTEVLAPQAINRALSWAAQPSAKET